MVHCSWQIVSLPEGTPSFKKLFQLLKVKVNVYEKGNLYPNNPMLKLIPLCCITSSTAQGGGGSFKDRKPIGEVGCCESRMAERIH